MDFRRIFDQSVPPEEFDQWRTRYCDELFAELITYTKLGPGKAALEIGPGTGQATGPILETGCSYLGLELGENFAKAMEERFGTRENFRIANADFETHDFGQEKFDLVYSAATIQWIPEEIAFKRSFDLLKSGGTLAMMLTRTDYQTSNNALYEKIGLVYDRHFHPQTQYTCNLAYENVQHYGFVDFECRHYPRVRQYNADAFIAWTIIQAPHLTLQEPHRSRFIEGIRDAIEQFGNSITLLDDNVLYLAKKP